MVNIQIKYVKSIDYTTGETKDKKGDMSWIGRFSKGLVREGFSKGHSLSRWLRLPWSYSEPDSGMKLLGKTAPGPP